jgi:O-antigen/teichoic acid export membrane protein
LFSALRLLPLDALGKYTLVSTLVILAQTSIRSLVLEPLTIRFSTQPEDVRRRATAMAAGASASLGIVAVVATVTWAIAGGSSGRLMVAAGITFAILLVQDAWRTALFASRRPWGTAANDAICLAATLIGLTVVMVRGHGHADAPAVMIIWGFGSAFGAVLGVFQLRALPKVQSCWHWLRTQADLGLRLVGSVLAQQLAGRTSLVIVSVWAGHAALGQISASRTLVSPISTLILATLAFAVPEAARKAVTSLRDLRHFTRMVSGALVAVTALLTVVLYFLPERIGVAIAGQNWAAAHSLLVPTALWIAGTAMSQGARIGLRVLERASTILWISVALGAVVLVACACGTLGWGAPGAAWAFGLASVAGQAVWTVGYRRATASRQGTDESRTRGSRYRSTSGRPRRAADTQSE